MSKTSEFWEYAKEAVLAAAAAKTDNERQSLIDLARTWTQAALQEQLCTSLSILSSPSAKGTHHVVHRVLH
jgi:hypothetical protein